MARRSAPKQSRARHEMPARDSGLRRFARNDGGMSPQPRGAIGVRALHQTPFRNREGAGKAGHRLMPVAPVRTKSTGQEPQVQPDDPAFPARWVTAYSVLSPGIGILAPVRVMRGIIALRQRVKRCAERQHRGARTTRLDRPRKPARANRTDGLGTFPSKSRAKADQLVRRRHQTHIEPSRPPLPASRS